MSQRESYIENGRKVTVWFHGVTPIMGGWVARRCRWVRGPDGWDLEEMPLGRREVRFATKEAALERAPALFAAFVPIEEGGPGGSEEVPVGPEQGLRLA